MAKNAFVIYAKTVWRRLLENRCWYLQSNAFKWCFLDMKNYSLAHTFKILRFVHRLMLMHLQVKLATRK